MRARLGVARAGAGNQALEGDCASDPVRDARTGVNVIGRFAAALAGHGDLCALHGAAPAKCHGSHLGTGGPIAQAGMGASGSSKGTQGDRYAVERQRRERLARSRRQAPGTGLHLRGQACVPSELDGQVRALKRAGIEIGNDLWTLGPHGTCKTEPMFALREMAGWKTEKMVRRYAHRPWGIWPCTPTRAVSRQNSGTVAAGAKTPRFASIRKITIFWWPGRELNPRHADFQSAALPTELPGRTQPRIKQA